MKNVIIFVVIVKNLISLVLFCAFPTLNVYSDISKKKSWNSI